MFGNLSIYIKKENQNIVNKNDKAYEVSNDMSLLNEIYNMNYELIKILNDHTSEIKYIDYNPRLNLLIDYALDGYINLYTMPSLKLILSIQTKDFGINEVINQVVLISNPFPMICCATSNNIIIFDINGKYINTIKNEKGIDIKFCIDKNYGLFNDYISFMDGGRECICDLF